MKKKFLVSFALIAGIFITGVASQVSAVGNVKDHYYALDFSKYGGSAMTKYAREKYDSTSAYSKFLSIQDGASSFRIKVVDRNGNDFSRTWWTPYFNEYTIPGTETYIKNYAYEDRGPGVMVRLKGEGGNAITSKATWCAEGEWSPDSV